MTRSFYVLLCGILVTGALFGCGPKKETEFEINIVPATVNLIDGTWYKCGSIPSDGDLAKLYFTASRIDFKWKSASNRLIIQQVKITIEGSGITLDTSLSGDELVAMFSSYESPAGSGAIVFDPSTNGTTNCGLRVGGILLPDENSNAFFTARVRIKGIEIDADGDSVGNVTGEQTINVEYEP